MSNGHAESDYAEAGSRLSDPMGQVGWTERGLLAPDSG